MIPLKGRLAIYAVVVSVGGAIFAYQEYKLQQLQEAQEVLTVNNSKLTSAVEEQSNAIIMINEVAEDHEENRQRLNQEVNSARRGDRRRSNKLKGYRGTIKNRALIHPEEIERRAHDANYKLMHEFAAETRRDTNNNRSDESF